MTTPVVCKWKSDLDKPVLSSAFDRRRGWRKADVDGDRDDWNLYWATKETIKQVFHPDSGVRLGDHQLINHFPNHSELTRKDLMVKNIKRYKRENDGRDTDGSGDKRTIDIVPTTYVLPADYSLFVEEFRREPHSTWIMKPTGKSQGVGIFLINKVAQVKKWANRYQSLTCKDWYVVSKYIDDPLLIGGKKFDLRLYVLVLSYRPLKVYMSRQGFARFCSVKFSYDLNDIDNMFVHLTNVAVQKKSEDYNRTHGGKWDVNNLRLFLTATFGHERTCKLFEDIQQIVIHSLKACQNVMINDKHCFEMYGYDIIIDQQLKPWLIEVNASPSLTVTTEPDRLLKASLINDLTEIVLPEGFQPDVSNKGLRIDPDDGSTHTIETMGDFELLIDEAAGVGLFAGGVGGAGGGGSRGGGGGGGGRR